MKNASLFFLFLIILTSCIVNPRKIIQNKDEFTNMKQTKMKFDMYGKSDEDREYKFTFLFVTEEDESDPLNKTTTIELSVSTAVTNNPIDSVLYFKLDDKIYQLKPDQYEYKTYRNTSYSTKTETDDENKTISKTTSSQRDYQKMKLTFIIPEDLQYKIIMANKLFMRVYFRHELVDIKFPLTDADRVKKYFGLILSN